MIAMWPVFALCTSNASSNRTRNLKLAGDWKPKGVLLACVITASPNRLIQRGVSTGYPPPCRI